jgi:hypothetical protein
MLRMTVGSSMSKSTRSNASDDGGKLDVQIHTFEQAHIVNTRVSKLSHTEGLEPCQLLMATDGEVIVVVYRRHLHVLEVAGRHHSLMLRRHGG